MNKLWLGILASALLLACTTASAATTYYVKPSGDDAKDGKSDANAWQTVAKVNATAFVAGDTILFARGGEWREQLLPSSSGAAGSPITYDAYGTGNKPVLWGSDILLNANFTSAGGNNYNYNIPNLPGGEIFALQNHVFIGTGPVTYNNPTLTITSTTNPVTDGNLYTVCTRGNEIYSNGMSHLVFRNFTVNESAGQMGDGNDQGYGIRIQNSQDVLVENCDALRCGRHNMAAINAHQVTFKGCYAAYVAPLTAADQGNSLYVSYADGGAPFALCDSAYENCTADHQDNGTGGTYDFYDSHGSNLGAVAFKNTTSHGWIYVGGGTAFSMTGGTMLDGHLENFIANIMVDGVTFKNNAQVDQYGNGGTFQNCLFDNINGEENGCFILRGGAANNIIRFNTIVASGGACLAFYIDNNTGAVPTGTQWYGNIMLGTATMQQANVPDIGYVDYNFYSATPTILGNSFTAWQALGKDTHSLTGDPKFTNAANGDYTLQATSTALNAAAVQAAMIPATDFAGTSRPQGSGADMGAYELPSGPSVSISSPANNANVLAGGNLTITANATDTTGTVTKVEFFDGATKLGEDTNGADGWSYAWTGVPSGSHSLTAKASDDGGKSNTSAAVSITAAADLPPFVRLTQPHDGEVAPANSTITLSAIASDVDGTISKVEFFQGTTKIGEDTDGSDGWTLSWANTLTGTLALKAVATDNSGSTAPSTVVNITVYPATSAGTTYYVSNTGDDTKDGKSPANAWKTVAKVNASTFNAGDYVLFQRGGEWHESLVAPASGAAGNPIVFGSYGTGNKPKFWGSDVLANANFTLDSGTTYKITSATTINCVLINHAFIADKTSVTDVNATTNSWFYDAGTTTLYVNSGTDPATDGKIYTAAVRDNVVNSNGQSNLVFRDLIVDECARYVTAAHAGFGINVNGGQNVQLQNCEVYHAGDRHVSAVNCVGFVATNVVAGYTMPDAYYPSAFYCNADGGGPDTYVWRDCVFDNAALGNGTYADAFHAGGAGMASVQVVNLTSHYGNVDFGTLSPTVSTMTGGLLDNAKLMILGSGLLVDGVTITGQGHTYDQGIVDILGGSNSIIQNCLITQSGQNPANDAWFGFYIRNAGTQANPVVPTNNVIRFNTITMSDGAAGNSTFVTLVNTGSLTSWYGNIMYGSAGQTILATWAATPGPTDVAYADYNLYSPNAHFTFNWGPDSTLADFQALGFDTHSKTGDPLFTNAATGDYSLQTGSPALDAANVAAGNVPATDFVGVPRPVGAGPDMGAFERNGATATLTNHAPVISTTTADLNPAQVGATVTFTVIATDPDGDPMTYTWGFDDGNTATGVSVTHAFASAGNYAVMVTVSDGKGGTANGNVAMVVTAAPSNHSPVISSAGANPSTAHVGDSIGFNAAATDQDGDPLTYTWNFGDSSGTATGASVNHSFSAAQDYTVQVTVTDGKGGSATNSFSVTILANTVPVVVNSITPNTGPLAGGNVATISGSGFVDGGTTVEFGGVDATILLISPDGTQLTVTVPTGLAAGPVTVDVTTAGGTDNTAYTYTTDVVAPVVNNITPTSGPLAGGNVATISGTGFVDGSTTVTFGNVNATVTTVSADGTQITLTVPPGAAAGQVTVVVATQDGNDHTSYTYKAPPVVATIVPAVGPTAGGTLVTITGQNFANGDTVWLGGVQATGVTFVNDTTLTATTPHHNSGLADVQVVDPTLEDGTGSGTGTLPQAYNFNDPPVFSGMPVVTPAVPFANKSFTISVSTSDPDGDALTLTFSWGEGADTVVPVTGATTTVTHTYTTGGAKTVTISLDDGVNPPVVLTPALSFNVTPTKLLLSKPAAKVSGAYTSAKTKTTLTDSISFSGALPALNNGFVFQGQAVDVSVGGAHIAVPAPGLAGKGAYTFAKGDLNYTGSVSFKPKLAAVKGQKGVYTYVAGTPVPFSIKVKGDCLAAWQVGLPFNPAAATPSKPITYVTVACEIDFGGNIYVFSPRLKLTTKVGKPKNGVSVETGSFK